MSVCKERVEPEGTCDDTRSCAVRMSVPENGVGGRRVILGSASPVGNRPDLLLARMKEVKKGDSIF